MISIAIVILQYLYILGFYLILTILEIFIIKIEFYTKLYKYLAKN